MQILDPNSPLVRDVLIPSAVFTLLIIGPNYPAPSSTPLNRVQKDLDRIARQRVLLLAETAR